MQVYCVHQFFYKGTLNIRDLQYFDAEYSLFFILMCSEHKSVLGSRVETSTEFATRVPDTHYPTGTRVLVTVNLVSD